MIQIVERLSPGLSPGLTATAGVMIPFLRAVGSLIETTFGTQRDRKQNGGKDLYDP